MHGLCAVSLRVSHHHGLRSLSSIQSKYDVQMYRYV